MDSSASAVAEQLGGALDVGGRHVADLGDPMRSGTRRRPRRAASKPTVCASTYAWSIHPRCDELAQQPVHQGQVRAGPHGQVHVGLPGDRRGAWIDREHRRRVGRRAGGRASASTAPSASRRRCGRRARSRRSGRRRCTSRAGRRCRSSPSARPPPSRCTAGCCRPCVACRCRPCRSRRGCSTPRGTAARWCRSRSVPTRPARRAAPANARRSGPWPCPSRSRPAGRRRRTSGRVSRSGLLFACQPYRSLGPSRPRLTRSSARPRTPTMRPSLTAMSIASPLECSTDADWDPALDVVAPPRRTVDPLRPGLAPDVRRTRTPRIGDAIRHDVPPHASGPPSNRPRPPPVPTPRRPVHRSRTPRRPRQPTRSGQPLAAFAVAAGHDGAEGEPGIPP